jgi:hypothetical protein
MDGDARREQNNWNKYDYHLNVITVHFCTTLTHPVPAPPVCLNLQFQPLHVYAKRFSTVHLARQHSASNAHGTQAACVHWERAFSNRAGIPALDV